MVNVLVYVNELSASSIPVEIAARVHTTDNVEIILVTHYDGEDDDLDPDLERVEAPQIRLSADRRFDISAYRELRSVAASNSADVVHTHHNATGSLAHLAFAGTGIPLIDTQHSSLSNLSRVQRATNSFTYPLIDTIVSNSRATDRSHAWYEDILSCRTERTVIYNGVDVERIDAADNSVDIPVGPALVSVGRMIKVKNHELLIRALKTIHETHPEVNLVLVGDGPLLDDLKRLSERLGVRESVVFTGYLARREAVYSVLKQSDIGVFPSFSEGFCVAAVEAMAAGLPVVVSDIEALQEVVGDPGMFVDPRDPAAFAERVTELLEDREQREATAKDSRKRARSRFSLERTAQEYAVLYRKLAEKQY